jgi:hypothetical protein
MELAISRRLPEGISFAQGFASTGAAVTPMRPIRAAFPGTTA